MKAMILSDLVVMRKILVQQAVVGLVLGIVLAFCMENIYVVVPPIGTMMSMVCTFTVLALDERNKWETYRLTLPLSRTNVVLGRYASLAVAAVIGFVVGLAASLVTIVIATVGMDAGFGAFVAQALSDGIDWGAYALEASGGLAIVAVMLGVMLPLAARFGMTKAMRFIPGIFMAVILVAVTAATAGIAQPVIDFCERLFASPSGIVGFSLGTVAISVAIYAASAAIACRLYASREL